ncbi:MAG: glycosyltransferase [bacterium P3]|nr:MAG: glycosyltransferase [bacterium P201]KWW30479.1 MAG: glycosyltransferase [bacterium P3]KWW41366.1 MAG: glycosyltransferase [bacterium F083]
MISVFIPTYNGARYVGQTIDSLQAQSYEDFEVVCVDDGSTDDTWQILTERQREDSRIRIVRKCHEGDVPHAWQHALPMLHGSHTLYMSQDDMLEADTLQRLVDRQKATHADAVIPTVVFWEEGKPDSEVRVDRGVHGDASVVLSGLEALTLMMDYTIPGFALWNTELIRSVGMRTEAYNSDEVAQREWVARCRTVAFSEGLFRYRRDNAGSLTRTFSSRLFARPLSNGRLLELAQQHRIDEALVRRHRDAAFAELWWCAMYACGHRREYSRQQRKLFRVQFSKAYRLLHRGAASPGRTQRLAARNELLFWTLIALKIIRNQIHV